ncbi:MAG: Trk family potassium uptake protein [Clostridia bacterium]|nr:Trk family potassium uptake protein [Clostridia bacterium]
MENKKKFSVAQIILLGFLSVIAAGTLLLCLPFSSASGKFTDFTDAFFTATSATCVTGLSVFVTAEYWSVFGQTVILLLIQVGGLGFMTFVTLIIFFIHGQVGLFDRKVLMQSAGIPDLGSVFKLFRRILLGTLVAEILGAALLTATFIPEFGVARGIYLSVFHAVSAFCNAGFDILGNNSLMSYGGNPIVILTVSALIIVGGLGFIVWSTVLDGRFRWKKFNLQTKIVLLATFVLVIVPTLLFLAFEWNYTLKDMPFGKKLLAAFFQAVSPRTAGFYTVDQSAMSDSAYVLTVILMFIGGNSGSTAGGIKKTTFVIIMFSVVAEVRKSDRIIIGNRKLPTGDAKTASAILSLYNVMIFLSAMIICAVEPSATLKAVMF